MDAIPTYRYTRQRGDAVERFSVGPDGAVFDRGDGSEPINLVHSDHLPLSADVIASTVVDLTIAGWVADPVDGLADC